MLKLQLTARPGHKTEKIMKPSNFTTTFPHGSIERKCEPEGVAINIMVILERTGNEWRRLSWKEYKTERMKDGGFYALEKTYFDSVIEYTTSPDKAAEFSPKWNKNENP